MTSELEPRDSPRSEDDQGTTSRTAAPEQQSPGVRTKAGWITPLAIGLVVLFGSAGLSFAPGWANWPGAVDRRAVYAFGVSFVRTLGCTLLGLAIGMYFGLEGEGRQLTKHGLIISLVITLLTAFVFGVIFFGQYDSLYRSVGWPP